MAAASSLKAYTRFTFWGRLPRFLPLGTPSFKRSSSFQLAPVVGERSGILKLNTGFPCDVVLQTEYFLSSAGVVDLCGNEIVSEGRLES